MGIATSEWLILVILNFLLFLVLVILRGCLVINKASQEFVGFWVDFANKLGICVQLFYVIVLMVSSYILFSF